MIKKLAKHNRF